MRHRQTAAEDVSTPHLHQAATLRLVGPPTVRRIALAQCGDVPGLAVHYRQAVEVAAVLGCQGGDERRLPPWDKAVIGVECTQTGEAGVDHPQLVARPGHL